MIGAGHRSSSDFDLHVLDAALALPQLGSSGVAEARIAVDRIRSEAREAAAERFVVPEIGPVLVRTDTGAPGGQARNRALSPRARAWAHLSGQDTQRRRPGPSSGTGALERRSDDGGSGDDRCDA